MLNIKFLLSISILGVFLLANALTTFIYKDNQPDYSSQFTTPYGTIDMSIKN